jgi:hypothetical protein
MEPRTAIARARKHKKRPAAIGCGGTSIKENELKASELIEILKKDPEADVMVLSYKPVPVKIATAYHDKKDDRHIIEVD